MFYVAEMWQRVSHNGVSLPQCETDRRTLAVTAGRLCSLGRAHGGKTMLAPDPMTFFAAPAPAPEPLY